MPPTPDLRRFGITPIPRGGNSRPHQIAARLREQFLAGSMRPGDRIPSERDLAAALQVSRAALREGLRILEAEGLLNVVHGRGTFVVDAPSRATVTRETIGAPAIISREILELMLVRRILEPEAAALAARHIRRPEITALRKICERGTLLASREEPNFDRLMVLNRKFHLSILTASGNGAIERIVAGILSLLEENSRSGVRREERALRSWAPNGDHYLIVEAIVAGDAAAARTLMFDHLEYGDSAPERKVDGANQEPVGN
jgi:GntR family transcriptional repressor for pyruvate dehydrogenase complex